MRERKLKERFSAVAERLRHAQLTAEQLSALHSLQYFYAHNGEQRILAKLRTFLIGAVILLIIAVCITLSPLSQLSSILFNVCGLQVMYVVALLQNNYILYQLVSRLFVPAVAIVRVTVNIAKSL